MPGTLRSSVTPVPRSAAARFGDGEGVAVGVAEGEHGGHPGPAKDLLGVDTGAYERRVSGFGVVGGESDAYGSAREPRCHGFERDDGVR